ncbi:MAG TPA: TetR/AcrR family transcriptional regulator [Candidatus Aquicultor sp.]
MSESFDSEKFVELLEEETGPMSKRERTRLKIMASAAQVFDEKGFHEASIQDIADNAGIAKGTVYYYVDKKEDLLLMLLRFGKTRAFSKIDKALAKADTASGKLEAIIRTHLKAIKTVGPVIPFFVQNIMINDSRAKETITGLREDYLALVGSVIDEGIQSGEFRQVNTRKSAIAVMGLIIGQLVQYKAFNGKINAKDIADTTLDLVLHSLRVDHED